MSKTLKKLIAAATFIVVGISSTNTAAAPKPVPGCSAIGLDLDGDGFCVADPARPAPVDDDALAAFDAALGPVDCNDSDPGLNPGASEIVADGIDQDCRSGDLVFSVSDAIARAFGCNPKSEACMTTLEAEINACTAATSAQCEVVVTLGKFAIKRGFHWIDKNCDGVREVLDQGDYDKFLATQRAVRRVENWEPNPAYAGRCENRSACGTAPTGCGRGHGSVRKAAKAATTVKQEDEQNAAIGAVTKSVTDLTVVVNKNTAAIGALQTTVGGEDGNGGLIGVARDHAGHLNRHAETLYGADGNGGLAVDVKDLKEGVADLKRGQVYLNEEIGKVSTKADEAVDLAERASEAGFLFEGVLGFGLQSQAEIPIRSNTGADLGNARGSLAPSLQIGAHIGVELEDGTRVFLDGRIAPTWNEDPNGEQDAGVRYSMGAASEWHLTGAHHLGAFTELALGDDGGNVVAPNAKSRAVLLGPSYTYLVDKDPDLAQLGVNIQAGVGYENNGTTADGFSPTNDSSAVFMIRVAVLPGIGALN